MKEHLNIGTIGHIDHGKTTLTSALTYYLCDILNIIKNKKDYNEIDKSPEEKLRGITINTSHIEYETNNRHYVHIDCPGHADYIKNMIVGANQMDGTILVVSVVDGPMLQTREHLLLIKQVIGVKNILVFLNKIDLIEENDIIELVELEILDLLNNYGFNMANISIIKGSALQAIYDIKNKVKNSKWYEGLQKIIHTIDNFILPKRDYTKKFLMSVEDIFSITGRGTVVTGKIEKGKIELNDKINILGFNYIKETTVIGLESFNKTLNSAKAGYNIGILLRNIQKKEIKRGMLITHLNSYELKNKFKAKIYFLNEKEGGRNKPIKQGYRPQFFFRTINITGILYDILNKNKIIFPGDIIECIIQLTYSTILDINLNFSLREGGKTIASGTIIEIL